MGEKPEVLDAVLKETVDLVMDLMTELFKIFLVVGCANFLCFKLWADDCVCVCVAGEHSH